MKKDKKIEGGHYIKLPLLKMLLIIKLIVVLICVTGLMDSVAQQGNKVTGKVSDKSGASVPGVTVLVKGTTSGIVTDIDGNYTLTNVPQNA